MTANPEGVVNPVSDRQADMAEAQDAVTDGAVTVACVAYDRWVRENINTDHSNKAWPEAMRCALEAVDKQPVAVPPAEPRITG
jgi:hypothetical protein